MTPDDIVAALRAPTGDVLQRRGDHAVDFPGSKSRARAFADGELISRPAAVLVPLVKRDAGLHVILTRRTDHLSDHAGQISFPAGGRKNSTQPLKKPAPRDGGRNWSCPPSHRFGGPD